MVVLAHSVPHSWLRIRRQDRILVTKGRTRGGELGAAGAQRKGAPVLAGGWVHVAGTYPKD
jgi:uncharacterized membrane protein YqiK